MNPFLGHFTKRLLYLLLFLSIPLRSCVQSVPTSNDLETPTVFSPSQTRESLSSPYPSATPTVTDYPWPFITTAGYYAIVHYTRIPTSVFQDYWDDSYCVISLVYGEGIWAATLDNHETCGSQSILISTDFPEQEIESASMNGFYVTSLAYGDGQWVVILSQISSFSGQQIKMYSTFPPDDALSMRSKGYWITNVAYKGGSWVVVYSKTGQISSQHVESFPTFPWEYVGQEAANQMFLTAQVYGNSMWAIVLSNIAALGQDIYTQLVLTKDIVVPYWDDAKYYYRISLFYGEDKWFAVGHKELP